MQARFADLENADKPSPDGKNAKPASVAGRDAAKKTAPNAQGKDGTKPDDKDGEANSDKKTVSVEAFEKRVSQLTARSHKAEQTARQTKLDLGKAHKALELLSAEHERLRAAWRQGKAYDPRDEEVGNLRLGEKARQLANELDAADQKALVEATQHEEFIAYRDELAAQMDDALGAHPLVHRSEVIALAKTDPSLSLEDAAAQIEARKLEIAQQRFGLSPAQQVRARTVPSTINARPGGHVRKQHPPTRSGMLARFDELQAGAKD